MRWIILVFALLFSTGASAQCSGVFPNGYVCGNNSGVPAPPTAIPGGGGGSSGLTVGTTTISGGANGRFEFNNSGILGEAALGTMSTQNANAVAITGGTITGLPSPSVTADAATKGYVDAVAVGLTIHTQVSWATTTVLPNTPTYNNGSSGVGATLTAGGNAAIAVDGGSPAGGDRVLVKNQAAGLQNGVYTVTTVGSGSVPWVLTRATDFNTATAGNMAEGAYFFVGEGTTNIASSWVFVTTGAITIGTTALSFAQFSNGSGTPVANNNLLANTSGSTALPIGTTASSFFDSACSSTAGMAWIRTTVAWVCSQFLPLDPVWFGADPTGVADSATAINAAIAALPATGGQVNFAHCGTYSINSSGINIGNGSSGSFSTRNGIRLTTSGFGGNNNSTALGCVTLKWTNASALTVVTVSGPMTGFEISGFTIDCNNVAANGLYMQSVAVWESRRGLNILNCRTSAALLTAVNGINTMEGVADNWRIQMPAVANAIGVILDGVCSGGAGSSVQNDAYQNTFNNLQIFPNNTVNFNGLYIKGADTNTFNSLLIFSNLGTANASSHAVVFDYTGCNFVPSVNYFNLPDVGFNIPSAQQWVVSGSPTGPANILFNISTLNGGVTPGANAAWVVK